MMQHTPGPWSIYDYGEEEAPTLVIHKDSATRICFMATPGSHGDPAIIEANAHLIVAAPDLLAAAKMQEAAEAFHLSCVECEGNEIPELCEACFPHYDDARVARRNAIAAAISQDKQG
jgi:hypothetical protein